MLSTMSLLPIVIELLSVLFYVFIWMYELKFSDSRRRESQQSKARAEPLALVCQGEHATFSCCAGYIHPRPRGGGEAINYTRVFQMSEKRGIVLA
jgi:hypothetical protein